MDLTSEILSPRDFREAWAHALVECFEIARDATAASREAAQILATATHGEQGLIAMARKTVVDSIRAVDVRATALEREHIAAFEDRLADLVAISTAHIEAGAQRIVAIVERLEGAADRAEDQRAKLDRVVDEALALHCRFEAERERLDARRGGGLWRSLLGR
jgi:hypothetical protein